MNYQSQLFYETTLVYVGTLDNAWQFVVALNHRVRIWLVNKSPLSRRFAFWLQCVDGAPIQLEQFIYIYFQIPLLGMKRGIVEVADLVVINKSDGDLLPAARRIAMEYTSGLKYMTRRRKKWIPKVGSSVNTLRCV